MITENHSKECLNKAIIYALAGAARHIGDGHPTVTEPSLDYGLDGTFHHTEKRDIRMSQTGFVLEFQLKATKNWKRSDGYILYDLEKKNYNDMVIQNSRYSRGANKKALILYCMPPNLSDAFVINEQHVEIHHTCYYTFLEGEPLSSEVGKTPIKIPAGNILTPEVLDKILNDIFEGVMA